jgi:hypothetical protein
VRPDHRVGSRVTLTVTPPPRTPLVMPAIEPGWEKILQVPPLSSPRAQPRPSSGSWFPLRDSHLSRRVAVAVSAAAVAVTLACTRARFDAHRVPVRLCACARWVKVGPLALVTHTPGVVVSARRATAVLPRGCRSARARGGKGEAFAVPRETPPPSRGAHLDAAGRDPPSCFFPLP